MMKYKRHIIKMLMYIQEQNKLYAETELKNFLEKLCGHEST